MISVTLQFTDIAAAAHALMRIATPEQFAVAVTGTPPTEPTSGPLTPGLTAIAHADRPDVGAPEAPADPFLAGITAKLDPAAAAFGGAVAQAAPLVAPPTPPAAPSMPTAATGPTAAPVTVERDATGLVWDGRIHASTKTKTKEGVWTAKRNVDAIFKAQVEADLRGVAAPAPAPAAAAPATPPAAPPVAPAAGPAPTFAAYMAQVGEYYTNQPIKAMEAMTAALVPHGMQHVGQLAGRPDLIPQVDAEFRRLLG